MMLRKFKYGVIAAASLAGLAFGASPASAGGCGYYSCAPVVYVPVYQSCGCGASGYYYARYAYDYVPSYYDNDDYVGYRRYYRHRHYHKYHRRHHH